VVRWLNRVWAIAAANSKTQASDFKEEAVRELRRVTHQTIKRVTEDFEKFEFNTIVSGLMEMTNALYQYRAATQGTPAWDEAINTLLLLMAPVTPHIAEELWARRGPYSIHQQAWPSGTGHRPRSDHHRGADQRQGARPLRHATVTRRGGKGAGDERAKKHMNGQAPKKVLPCRVNW
jgi:leucyl-tRNA synthetase